MNKYLLLLLPILSVAALAGDTESFPGVKNLMEADEYNAAGLDKLTPEERDFTRRRYGERLPPAIVTGMGVDAAIKGDAARWRRKHGIEGPFLLYAGRIDESKNCDLLLKYFVHLKEKWGGELSLVLIGKSLIALPRRDDVHYLGFVDEQDKHDAFAAAHAFVLPSHFESLSIVLLESWLAGRPVLVNADCEVAMGQTQRARGGLWYGSRAEFCAAVRHLLEHPAQADQLGRQGREYVTGHYSWPAIREQFRSFILNGK